MRPADNSKEEVIAAGLELQAEGKSVTGFGLRGLLGGGNAQRLKSIWDEYVAGSNTKDSAAVDFAPELLAALNVSADKITALFMGAVKEAYAQANKAADKRINEALQDAKERQAGAESELEAAEALADAQLQTLNEKKDVIAELNSKLAEVTQRMNDFAVASAASAEREKALAAELLRSTVNIDEYLLQIKSLQSDKSELIQANAELDTKLQVLTHENEQKNISFVDKISGLEKELDKTKKSLALETENFHRAETSLQELRIAGAGISGELKAITDQNNKLLERINSVTGSANEAANATKGTTKGAENKVKNSTEKAVKQPLK